MKTKDLPAAKARTGTRPHKKPKQARKVSARKSGVGAAKKTGRLGDLEKGKKKKKAGRSARTSVKAKKKLEPFKRVLKAAKKRAGAFVALKKVKAVPVAGPEVALEDGQQERFCRLMADGRYSGRSCYAQAFGCENEASARTGAWRLLTNVDITARIEWLKKDSLKGWNCEKEEVMRFLHHVITTPVGYVDEESPLAQEVQREEMTQGGARGQLKRGQAESGNEEESPEVEVTKVKIKMPGKVEAAKLLAQMQGWEKPTEINVNLPYEPPSKAIERLSSRGIDLAAILAKAGIVGRKA